MPPEQELYQVPAEIVLSTETLPAKRDGGDVTSLVQLALEKNVDVSIIERLVALKERVDARDARAAFFVALSNFQEHCPDIRKSRTAKIATRSGGEYSYKYAPLDVISQAIRPVLKENGLSYSWDVEPGNNALLVVCVVRHIEGHEERARFPVPLDTAAKMSDAQKNGAALTYGKRQSLVAVLGLTTTDDDVDGKEPPPASAETINEQQAADLDALIEEVGISKDRFLKWLKVESIASIPASEYERAVAAVEAKRK